MTNLSLVKLLSSIVTIISLFISNLGVVHKQYQQSSSAAITDLRIPSLIWYEGTNSGYYGIAIYGYLAGSFSINIFEWLLQYVGRTAEIRFTACSRMRVPTYPDNP